jgi:hypothetical protein
MKSFEQKLLGRLYCFCGGGDDDPGGDAARAEQEAYDAAFNDNYYSSDTYSGDFGTGYGVDSDTYSFLELEREKRKLKD